MLDGGRGGYASIPLLSGLLPQALLPWELDRR
jgi:hypothetical protein